MGRLPEEKRIIAASPELSIGFSKEVDILLTELARVATVLNIDVDELIDVLYRRRTGQLDEELADMVSAEEEE